MAVNSYVEDTYAEAGYFESGIEVIWGQKIIFVPKSELTLIQSTPTEIRELNADNFRLALKALEDDPEGMPFQTTHNHIASITVGGVQLAKVVEIINDYTVTFEDGSYAVNITGANTNIGDRVNVNNVSVRSANSAGLVQTREIEYGSFQNGVWVDVTSAYAGTGYPNGTPRQPVNNFADALLIAQLRGFGKIYVNRNCTFDATADFDNFEVQGRSPILTAIQLDATANVQNCKITDCTVTGTLDGGTLIERCITGNLTYINGVVFNSMLNPGTITLGGDSSNEAHFINCYAGRAGGPVIDCAGDGPTLLIRNYNGTISLTNKTGTAPVVIDLNAGKVVIYNTVTAGSITVRGLGELVDEFGNEILSGSWNGCTIDNDTVTSNHDIAAAVMSAAQITPIHADTRKMNGATVTGTGTSGDLWRGV